ncbi:hypothetical protein JKP88DRAFT_311230 [Tribonema minus]|uniref:DNA mismatch repair protein S5 domain-containing protein n=1 Tax=Tribonema minus TaxID=303371 RepID=A0A836CHJ0_9STRA|nr:hypothetical protein JKP88DRAFT_311230 [Tribonema minus]
MVAPKAGDAGAARPPQIHKLEEHVVNRIAAGEVVQRPANAVKEMLENSLDAGSKSITVTCKEGGMKLLEIKDDGHGIRKDDMRIVCERFTTSKLQRFEDLTTISTFGFRGEALASITHVARVTITSKTRDSPCAYRARYHDGKVIPLRPGDPAEPRPCAGNQGTTISVEDLFYNMDTRRRAFKSAAEQYALILDVVTRYAIHYGDSGVSFTCKRHGSASADLHTPAQSSSLANIRVAYGAALARELLELKAEQAPELLDKAIFDGAPADAPFSFRARGFVSNANYSTKRAVFILFINHRLVDSTSIRRTLESVYSSVLPKGTHAFIYLALSMPAPHLDVNVHPTKQEVHFLHEEALLERLRKALEDTLGSANRSRTFYSQSTLPGIHFDATPLAPGDADGGSGASGGGGKAKATGAGGEDGDEGAWEPDEEPSDDDDEAQQPPDDALMSQASSLSGAAAARQRSGGGSARPKRRDEKLVRVDARATSMDAFVVRSQRRPPSPPPGAWNIRNGSRRRPAACALHILGSMSCEDAASAATTPADASSPPSADTAANPPVCECPPDVVDLSAETVPLREEETSAEEPSGKKRGKPAATAAAAAAVKPFAGIGTSCACCGKRRQKRGAVEVGEKGGGGGGGGGGAVSQAAASQSPMMQQHRRPDTFVETRTSSQPHLRACAPALTVTDSYTSVRGVLTEMRANVHKGLLQMLRKAAFVGMVDNRLSLLQFQTKLVLVDHHRLAQEAFYQMALRRFGVSPRLKLAMPVDVEHFARAALDLPEAEWAEQDGPKDELAADVRRVLAQKSALLDEYFNVGISEGAQVALPMFILRLATDVEWLEERPCFETIATELSALPSNNTLAPFRPLPRNACISQIAHQDSTGGSGGGAKNDTPVANAATTAIVRDVLYPAFRWALLPPQEFSTNSVIVQVACLEKLYKVFERC